MRARQVLALDPSSTRTGYCILQEPERIVDAGYLSSACKSYTKRITNQMMGLRTMLAEAGPIEAAVVEMPAASVHSSKLHTNGAGLARYGVAVGRFWGEICRVLPSEKILLLDVTEWTRGTTKKKRHAQLALRFPAYATVLRNGEDKGGDIGDAIGLACYAMENWMDNGQAVSR